MSFTVGCVPYANAIPLVAWFEELGEESPVKVVYDIPSKLPALLDSGKADAVLVSSIDALLVPDRRMAEGVCIGSHGPVKSVRLFSKVAPGRIQSLALDQNSMTSNRLAQIILKERFGVSPATEAEPPNQQTMLEKHNACVLIGDIGMTAPSDGLYVLDLGEEWMKLTGQPFVWAAWIGNDRLTPELAAWLNTSSGNYYAGRDIHRRTLGARLCNALMWRWYREVNECSVEYIENKQAELISLAMQKVDWSQKTLRDYFFEIMVYDMDESVLDGYRTFQRLLLANGFSDCKHFPTLVANWVS
ncbi:MAG TPA: menaquinone biosynthesis protein [Fimbriimonas sp.]|nr:menaquinone biosynthesis protein [Fimbriimonas sp.]